ncbi:MAG: Gfo/Idh/MocA family oxidoreductase [Phycisphaerales bacterium]
MTPPVRFGMVGGGQDAFIGAIHRMALALDGRGTLVAGALSSTPDRAIDSARALNLAPERSYPTWRAMLEAEAQRPRDERIDAVSIVTPNHTHFEIASACLSAGFHVVLDKPMVCNANEAEQLIKAAERSSATLTVTYNYSGYPLVREARAIVEQGTLGAIRKVFVRYHQGWLSSDLESSGQKQAAWRTDPAKSGGAGALGDIGTHAEHLARFITGMTPHELCADVNAYVNGRRVDDDAGVLLRYPTGATGVLTCSQVCFGEENGLSIQIYGEHGALAWHQEKPNRLELRDTSGRLRIVTRGEPGLSEGAAASTRTPTGHPEGFIEAFANIYRGAIDRVRAHESVHASLAPDVYDGAAGIRFVEACLATKGAWVSLD